MQTINQVPFLRKTHGDVAFRKTPSMKIITPMNSVSWPVCRRLSLRPVDEQDKSLSVLTTYLETVMMSILNSVKECPSYMRAAFRNLARRVSDRFGDIPDYEVNHQKCLFVAWFPVFTINPLNLNISIHIFHTIHNLISMTSVFASAVKL